MARPLRADDAAIRLAGRYIVAQLAVDLDVHRPWACSLGCRVRIRIPAPPMRHEDVVCHAAVVCYTGCMTTKVLTDAIKRAQTWPEEAQKELAEIALEMDAALKGGVYHATLEELAGIDRGLLAADGGRFAAPDEVATVFAQHRPA
jgi:predicted transcriptional regulator